MSIPLVSIQTLLCSIHKAGIKQDFHLGIDNGVIESAKAEIHKEMPLCNIIFDHVLNENKTKTTRLIIELDGTVTEEYTRLVSVVETGLTRLRELGYEG